MYRIGNGFDVHAFAENRKLIIGGVTIDYQLGLLGHSDADVLLHSICDALLGALALGDIGLHFPDSDNKFKGINSLDLLKTTIKLIESKGYCVSNMDSTIIAQEPKMAPHLLEMRQNIANVCNTNIDDISIKATTTETLGFTGRKEGIASTTTLLLRKKTL